MLLLLLLLLCMICILVVLLLLRMICTLLLLLRMICTLLVLQEHAGEGVERAGPRRKFAVPYLQGGTQGEELHLEG